MRLVSIEMGILVDRRFKIKVVSMKRAVFVDRRHPSLLAASFKNKAYKSIDLQAVEFIRKQPFYFL